MRVIGLNLLRGSCRAEAVQYLQRKLAVLSSHTILWNSTEKKNRAKKKKRKEKKVWTSK